MKTRIIVAGIIQDRDRILLGKKAKGQPPYPDVWHTMGGGIEDIELGKELINVKDYDNPYFHNELRREILEEASISINNISCLCPKYRDVPREAVTKDKYGVDTHYIFLEYLCNLKSGLAIPGDDIAEVLWVQKDELGNFPLTQPSKEMYEELKWLT